MGRGKAGTERIRRQGDGEEELGVGGQEKRERMYTDISTNHNICTITD